MIPFIRYWAGRICCAAVAVACVLVGSTFVGVEAASNKVGGTCSKSAVGTVSTDAKGQPLVCAKVSTAKYRWALPALGSFLRPIPLGQSAEAGPAAHRFRVKVVQVNFDAAAEIAAEDQYATPPTAGFQDVRVWVEASFLGPAASGETSHYWYAKTGDGETYAASQGCSGGLGGNFDVTAVVPIGGIVKGVHCFELPAAGVSSLRLRVEGSDRPDTYFSLR